ncbi:ABC transporter substrate-binding protein [Fulvivirga kasyanovii]|uniref:ABC transporter substrate-binding protein n=1 Tax=Fulvivirga kasyanovii TaxID=396812 RepID=A0ABW9RIG4_9BACT|nr:ABC transporter substrate-binding protein [Fulvivirga kasyanovii]MTI23781.1 ABC transporter substrate-binding protein [Fulvivirga kasyanovii]
MEHVGRWMMCIAMICGCIMGYGQTPDKYMEFSLEELAAVDVEKPLLPVEVDSAYVVSGKTVNIGYILPISGYPYFTKELINSANLAIQEINNKGGVLNKKLALIPADIGGTEDFILDRTKLLANKFNTQLFIGPTSSDGLISISEKILPKTDLMVVSPTATSPVITNLNDRGLIFRTCPSDAIQGEETAKFCYNELNAKTAAVLYQNNFYGSNLKDAFVKNFENEGGKVLNTVKFNPLINLEFYDMSNKLDSLFQGKADMVYVISLAKSFSIISDKIAKQDLITKDYHPIIVSSDGARGEDLAKQGNLSVLEGMYGLYLPFTGNKEFGKKYEKQYGTKPFSLAAEYTYDIIYMISLAILEGNSTDPEDVSTHLTSISKNGLPVTGEDGPIRVFRCVSR